MNRMLSLILAAALAATLTGCTGRIAINTNVLNSCAYSAPRSGAVALDGAKSVRIEAAPGSLQVRGGSGIAEVRADGQACATQPSLLDDVTLRVDRVGDEIRVISDGPSMFVGVGVAPHLDFTVVLPDNLPVTIAKGSGSADVQNVASLDLDKGSGETHVDGVTGDARVQARSGEMTVRRVTGTVRMSMGSGEARIEEIGGDLVIDEKSSGSLTVRHVGHGVRIGRSGSGESTVEDVHGDVEVSEKSSGGLTIRQVGQTVRIGRIGSGSTELSDVQGDVVITEKSSGSLTIRRVGKTVSVDHVGSGSLDVRDVKGDLTVRSKTSGSIDYSGIGGHVSVPR